MARVEMRVSDLSEAIIRNEEDVMQIEVTHPDFTQAITLDVIIDDLEGNLPQPQEYVSVKVADQQYLMTVPEFNALFTGVQDAEEVLERAYREQEEERQRQEETPRRDRGRRRQQAGERRQRVDFSSPERAGLDHPGRISQAERDYVRDHREEVNQRRLEAGQEELDWDDPGVQARYGLSGSPT